MTETETSAARPEPWTQLPDLAQHPIRDRYPSQTALVAARIARVLAPASLLDLGESQALADHLIDLGIRAEHTPVVDAVGSAPEIKPGHWAVISCLGVLERLIPEHAEALLEQMCMSADTVVASCGPATYFAPAATTVRAAPAWAAGFAERGFFRRVDLDLEFAGPWTVVFERARPAMREVVYHYEQALAAAQAQLSDRSAAQHQRAASSHSGGDPESVITDLRHQLLVSRDYAIGQEAEMAQMQAEVEKLSTALDDVYASNTWRLGSLFGRPVAMLKRAMGPPRS